MRDVKPAVTIRPSFWRREHHLDRMTLRELVIAYFQYPAIIAYLALAVGAAAVWAWRPAPPPRRSSRSPSRASSTRSSGTSSTASSCTADGCGRAASSPRPGSASITTTTRIPTISRCCSERSTPPCRPSRSIVIPVGWAIGATLAPGNPDAPLGAAAAAFATGLVTTAFYEFVHCIQHLAYKPKAKWLAEMKRRHMAHHFHDETGNFGITSFLWDKAFGTFYDKASDRPAKSPTVFNLGYTPEVAEIYPHVARLSGGVATDHPRERVRQKAGAGS